MLCFTVFVFVRAPLIFMFCVFVEQRIINKNPDRLKTLKLKMFPFAKSLQKKKKKKELPIPELRATIGEIRLFHKSS